MTLTQRDLDLLETLACRVSVLRVADAARLGWATTGPAPRRRLQQLAKAGWLRRRVLNAHPSLPVVNPLFAWQPGMGDPDAERLSRLAKGRWSRAALPAEICIATKSTAALFGSTAGHGGSPAHLDHDLRLAAVYVQYRLHHPALAARWIGEHALPKAGYRVKDPDAFLRDDRGRILRVIESAGRYSSAQIESFHEYCVERAFPYELW